MKRLVSGLQPTGSLHLGNYIGAIAQFVELQHQYDSFFFVADYHSLTGRPTKKELTASTYHVLAMLIACSVDPRSATVFVQSQVPEHTELSWIFSNFCSVGQLKRMTQYKEKSDQYGQNVGLFTYPVLMAADVALYQAEVVPVGDDQIQHLELAREIIRSVNAHAGNVFTEPKPLLTKGSRIMSLSDPTKKMSKSLAGSAIGLLDDEATIIRNIKRAVTDSDPNSAKPSKALQNLFTILEVVAGPEAVKDMEAMRKDGKLRYSELKELLIEETLHFLEPIQKTYSSLIKDPKALELMALNGSRRARTIAQENLSIAKKALGLVG